MLAAAMGRLLRPVRPGLSATQTAPLGAPTMTLRSAAFDDGGVIPRQFTADSAGFSPPLAWSDLPAGTAALALLVEDVDAPFPRPLVHLVVSQIPPELSGLAEGTVGQRLPGTRSLAVGLNSYGRHGWLPPSPIPDHGPHRYVFQLLAFSRSPGRLSGRQAFGRAMRNGGVLGHGRLTGIYERK